MKLNNTQVCHEWANLSSTDNRGSNLFNEGRKLYSYGHHFLLAELFPDSSRGDIALVNYRNYSSTTAKHKRYTINALSSRWHIIEVPKPGPESAADHRDNVQYLVSLQALYAKKLSQARIRAQWYIDTLDGNAADYAAYVKRFPEAKKLGKLPKIKAKDLAEYKRLAGIYTAQEAKREAIRQQLRAEKEAAELIEWREHHNNKCFYNVPIALRLSLDAQHIETSRGASVDLEAAIVLYKAWRAGKNIHGLSLGSYTITSASPEHITIGCHDIAAAEAHNMLAHKI